MLAANTWGGNGLLSRHTSATNSSVFTTWDRQGGCAQRLDSSGNILGSYAFDGYGNRQSTDNSADPYSGYGGQWGYYRDAETGLSLLGARYYDPGQGRFLNRDPSGYEGGINLYGYAGNDPISFIDPEGLWDFYHWIYTGDGNSSNDVYQGSINQGANTLISWWNHFVHRNKQEWPYVTAGAAAGTLPYWSVPKANPLPGARRNTSVARMISLPNAKGGWLPDWLHHLPGFDRFIRKQILVPLAKEVKNDFRNLGPLAPAKGVAAGALIVEACIAWQATFDTQRDPPPTDDDE